MDLRKPWLTDGKRNRHFSFFYLELNPAISASSKIPFMLSKRQTKERFVHSKSTLSESSAGALLDTVPYWVSWDFLSAVVVYQVHNQKIQTKVFNLFGFLKRCGVYWEKIRMKLKIQNGLDFPIFGLTLTTTSTWKILMNSPIIRPLWRKCREDGESLMRATMEVSLEADPTLRVRIMVSLIWLINVCF